jgi:hypothetical protein
MVDQSFQSGIQIPGQANPVSQACAARPSVARDVVRVVRALRTRLRLHAIAAGRDFL